MITVQILGPGCPNCETLAANAQRAAEELGIPFTLQKITDLGEILAMGVVRTPAMAVDGLVRSEGKLLTIGEIRAILRP